MATVTNALLSVGSIRAGSTTRIGSAPTNASAVNSVDVVSTVSGTLQVGQLVYTRQDAATTTAVEGARVISQSNHPSGAVASLSGVAVYAEARGTGTTTNIQAGDFAAGSGGAGNVTQAYSVVVRSTYRTGAGTIATAGGVLIEAQTVGAANFALQTLGTAPTRLGGALQVTGSGSFGHTSPLTTLDIRGANAGEGAAAAAGGAMWVGNTTGGMIVAVGTQESPVHGFIQARMRSNANYERLVLQPSGGALLVGTLTVAGAANGDVIVKNAAYLRASNAAATSTLPLIRADTSDRTEVGLNSLSLSLVNPATTTTVGAAGSASVLPSLPLGYWRVRMAGVEVKIPYYTA